MPQRVLIRRRVLMALSAAAAAGAAVSTAWLPAARSRWWLPGGVVLALAVHLLLARALKALLATITPLASGAPEAAGYERSVHGTASRQTREIVGTVVVAGLLCGAGIMMGSGWVLGAGIVALIVAHALDVQRWERVAAGADWIWFQRGYGQKVYQVPIDNIRDVSVHEHEAAGFTLRHGLHNRVCRLNLRMADKRVVALPKTDALADLDDVESVANHIRTRQQLAGELAARRVGGSTGGPSVALSADDKALMRELNKLRRTPSKGKVPTLRTEIRRHPQA